MVEDQVAATAQQTVQASTSVVDTGKLSTVVVLSSASKKVVKIKDLGPLLYPVNCPQTKVTPTPWKGYGLILFKSKLTEESGN